MDLLLGAGACVNVTNLYGETPITMAAKTKKGCQSLEALITAGADVNILDPNGKPLLISAISKCTGRDTKLLINAGADVNTVDVNSNTALIITAEQNVDQGVECAKLLLKAGATINLINNKGRNALYSHIYKCADWNKQPDRTMVLLLYAAGETLDGVRFDDVPLDILNCLNEMDISLADILQTEKSSNQLQEVNTHYLDYMISFSENHQICLKSLCREKIRKCLLNLNRSQHLFYRVPKLGLPAALTQFMLFGISLDEK